MHSLSSVSTQTQHFHISKNLQQNLGSSCVISVTGQVKTLPPLNSHEKRKLENAESSEIQMAHPPQHQLAESLDYLTFSLTSGMRWLTTWPPFGSLGGLMDSQPRLYVSLFI